MKKTFFLQQVGGLILGGFVFFFILGKFGERILKKNLALAKDEHEPEFEDDVTQQTHYNYANDIAE